MAAVQLRRRTALSRRGVGRDGPGGLRPPDQPTHRSSTSSTTSSPRAWWCPGTSCSPWPTSTSSTCDCRCSCAPSIASRHGSAGHERCSTSTRWSATRRGRTWAAGSAGSAWRSCPVAASTWSWAGWRRRPRPPRGTFGATTPSCAASPPQWTRSCRCASAPWCPTRTRRRASARRGRSSWRAAGPRARARADDAAPLRPPPGGPGARRRPPRTRGSPARARGALPRRARAVAMAPPTAPELDPIRPLLEGLVADERVQRQPRRRCSPASTTWYRGAGRARYRARMTRAAGQLRRCV